MLGTMPYDFLSEKGLYARHHFPWALLVVSPLYFFASQLLSSK